MPAEHRIRIEIRCRENVIYINTFNVKALISKSLTSCSIYGSGRETVTSDCCWYVTNQCKVDRNRIDEMTLASKSAA